MVWVLVVWEVVVMLALKVWVAEVEVDAVVSVKSPRVVALVGELNGVVVLSVVLGGGITCGIVKLVSPV